MDTRKSVALELAGLTVLTALFLATFEVRPSYVDFALAAAAVVLIVATAPRSRRLWQAIPVPRAARLTRQRAAFAACAAFTAVALIVLALLGVLFDAGTATLDRFRNWHIIVAMALYFPWAFLQQLIFQFYLFGRLLQLAPLPLAASLTALAFASVHFPRWPVMGVIVIAGAAWSLMYYRHRALLPLAASHAILGSALHYWVFGRDLLETWLTR